MSAPNSPLVQGFGCVVAITMIGIGVGFIYGPAVPIVIGILILLDLRGDLSP